MAVRIVITGAPGSGKTECINRLKKDKNLMKFVFFDELARKLLLANPEYRKNWTAFHIDIYKNQIKRENDLPVKNFISDRGTVDAFAFHPETAKLVKTTIENEYMRYDIVFHVASSANLGEEYYKQDEVRLESLSEALFIEERIKTVWEKHPNYFFIEADIDFDKKYADFYKLLMEKLKDYKI